MVLAAEASDCEEEELESSSPPPPPWSGADGEAKLGVNDKLGAFCGKTEGRFCDCQAVKGFVDLGTPKQAAIALE